ncbi:eukaryotic translation initiation factor 3 subunit H [Capronia coronata CBS 617.96]|uniref:Eukaryotic translation initiation factor 3 subunit H n=1 Tax=Capronia coronata CBS 617.96 TaxID=1182541 RepID=W9XZJ6_9EURO|nr:eukaryotic translation initiation factor 3 subunit H [Capronia coronata CBS 617.96]EXJ85962.1 eukaryotic translation initiation factor 3 subunit H [Capronia coronata CBS 617.96]
MSLSPTKQSDHERQVQVRKPFTDDHNSILTGEQYLVRQPVAIYLGYSIMATTAPIVEKDAPLKAVQLEALVVMKVIKHCASRFPTTATGSLVGMDINGTLEITNTFPFPVVDLPPEAQYEQQHFNSAAAAPRAKSNTAYQTEMIRMLREVNVDANNVGWYTSANLGNFVNANFIENQYHYQKELNERTVALVHDVSRSSQGILSIKAFRLSPQFMTAYKENKFTTENLLKSGLKYTDILVEIPVTVHNSHLVNTFLHQVPRMLASGAMKPPTSVDEIENNPVVKNDTLAPTFESLSINIDPYLSQTADNLLDSIETHHVESNNFSYYQRALAREQAKIQQWQAKRKAENAARALSKQAPLPEDEWQKLFKLPTEPSRLESMLNSRQVEQYARQVDGFVAATSGKMFSVRGNLLPGDGKEE